MPAQRKSIARSARKIAALALLSVYVLTGSFHAYFDTDAPKVVSSQFLMSGVAKDGDTSSKSVTADHHCHGCFSVSVAASAVVASTVEPRPALSAAPQTFYRRDANGIDPPPPKSLT